MTLTFDEVKHVFLFLLILCVILICAFGLIIYLIHRVDKQDGAIGYLLTKADETDKEIAGQGHSIRFANSAICRLEQIVYNDGETPENIVQGYPPVSKTENRRNGANGDADEKENGGTATRNAEFFRDDSSAKGVTPV